MIFRRRHHRAPPARCWFRADDGTYYRNCPLIAAERREVWNWPGRTPGKYEIHAALVAEWWDVFCHGVPRKTALAPGDVLAEPAPFREAYPNNPGLWPLDDLQRLHPRP